MISLNAVIHVPYENFNGLRLTNDEVGLMSSGDLSNYVLGRKIIPIEGIPGPWVDSVQLFVNEQLLFTKKDC
jgi:hypothetical protein